MNAKQITNPLLTPKSQNPKQIPLSSFVLTLMLVALLISPLSTASGYASGVQIETSHSPQLLNTNVQVQDRNYPLIGWQTFNGAVDDFYARFELLVYRDSSEQRVARLKAINPEMKVVWTFDWNACEIGSAVDCADEWQLRDSQGNRLAAYGNNPDQSPMMNMSDFAPEGSGGTYPGLTYIEAVPEIFEDMADLYCSAGSLDCFDGWGTNGIWGDTPGSNYEWLYDSRYKDVDIDLNCPANGGSGTWPACEDHNQFTRAEWISHWQSGIDTFMVELRQRLDAAETATGSPKLLIINSGTTHTWGWPQSNGIVDEKLNHYFDDSFDNDFWSDFNASGDQPLYSVADGMPPNYAPDISDDEGGKEAFRYMRFGLVTSMFNDVYYSFQDKNTNNPFSRWSSGGDVAQEHYWSFWYDEFDANLGKPTSEAIKIEDGLWVRFFEKGAAIASTDGATHTATDAKLRAFGSYDGPYFRFRGGQDPQFNNGAQFDSVSLEGHLNTSKTPYRRFGDGILLFKQPTDLVSDIIVDNVYHGTSPGSSPALLGSSFTQQGAKSGCTDVGSNYYTLRCSWNPGSYAFATATSGTATFTPTISVSGNYEVYEWHPSLNGGGEARQVLHTVRYAGGTESVTVDQSANEGKWNSLGVFHFSSGSSGSVELSLQSGGGTMLADAVKFVYRGNSPSTTFLDVPFDHWAHDEIETLYQSGYVSGCSSNPLLYCPEAGMTRAESAVFVERGVHGAGYIPAAPTQVVFADVPLWEWFAKWADGLFDDGYTAGCGTDPLIYCPLQEHTRTEGTVFFLRMLNGADYIPPDPTGIFADVSVDYWGAKWIEAAYGAGLIPACATSPELRFCPDDPLDRAMAAYMMVQAKALDIP
jgi:hypothetical protein